MTVVADASVVVAHLIGAGAEGGWAEDVLRAEDVVGPHILPAEAANVLRRAAVRKAVSHDVASLAHGDLLAMQLDLYPSEPFADRVWDLRASLSAAPAAERPATATSTGSTDEPRF